MIKVVIVNDSPTARQHLRETLESDPAILVLAEADTGAKAMQLVKKLNPDLVTMDILLKKENGLDITAALMATTPRPIIVIANDHTTDPTLTYKALDRGALEVFPKLPARTASNFEYERRRLLRLVKTLSAVPVATRWTTAKMPSLKKKPLSISPSRPTPAIRKSPRVFLIGASTGGPPIVNNLLKSLPKPFPIPIVLVQHISADFVDGFSDWLTKITGIKSVIVKDRKRLSPNTIYLAPDNRHIAFSSGRDISSEPVRPTDTICPSIDVLFKSAARHFGNTALGVLLTGMGKDGAAGLKQLKEAGSATIVQEPETCVVASMPRAAISLEAASAVLSPEKMTDALIRALAS